MDDGDTSDPALERDRFSIGSRPSMIIVKCHWDTRNNKVFLKPLFAENGREKDLLQILVAILFALLGLYGEIFLVLAAIVIPVIFLNVISNAYLRWIEN